MINWKKHYLCVMTNVVVFVLLFLLFIQFRSINALSTIPPTLLTPQQQCNVRKHIHTKEKMNWSMWTNNCSEFISVVKVGEKEREDENERSRLVGMRRSTYNYVPMYWIFTKKQVILNWKAHRMNECWPSSSFILMIES